MADDSYLREDELITRRAVRALRRAAPIAVVVALVVGAGAYLTQDVGESTFTSEGVVELTDEAASGINVARGSNNALQEIQAQLLVIESAAFRDSVVDAAGIDRGQLVGLSADNREGTPVIEITAEALSASAAEDVATAALVQFLAARVDVANEGLERELTPLRAQREEQLQVIDDLAGDLDAARPTATADEVSILESRTAAALRRLATYDQAIQEREFLILSSGGEVRVVNDATAAAEKTMNPFIRPFQIAVLALVLSLVAVVVLSRLRGKLDLLDDVRAVAGPNIPILATVPKFRPKLRKGREALVVGRRNTRREAEAFRYMRTAIEVATDGMTPVVIAFTSSGPNEGKTVTSSNFALATARAERSVALLDGDLLNPSTGKLFGVNGSNAFVGILSGRVDPTTEQWHRVVTSGEPLDLLVSGKESVQADRQELPTHAVEATFAKLAQMWDTVVVDCPPVLAVSDAMVLARAADVAILMVRMGHTTKRDLDKALTQLEQNQVNIAGIVVTHSTGKDESYYGYGYAYGAENG